MLDVSGHTKKKRTINMQKQLDNLYQTYLETLFSDKEFEEMIENFRVSSPQFLDTETPRGKYLSSEFKVVFIGKETNGWFNDNERKEEGLTQINRQFEKYIHSLKKIYSRHNIGANYRSPIYLFIDLLVERISFPLSHPNRYSQAIISLIIKAYSKSISHKIFLNIM